MVDDDIILDGPQQEHPDERFRNRLRNITLLALGLAIINGFLMQLWVGEIGKKRLLFSFLMTVVNIAITGVGSFALSLLIAAIPHKVLTFGKRYIRAVVWVALILELLALVVQFILIILVQAFGYNL